MSIAPELARKEGDRRWDETAERLRYSTEYAQAGLKGLFLSNGAAIIALLTFIGNTNSMFEPRALWWAFVWFSLGLTSVLGSYISAYLSQAILMNASYGESKAADAAAFETGHEFEFESFERNGELSASITLCLATISLGFFVAGAFVALDAIT